MSVIQDITTHCCERMPMMSPEEFVRSGMILAFLLARYHPEYVAVLMAESDKGARRTFEDQLSQETADWVVETFPVIMPDAAPGTPVV